MPFFFRFLLTALTVASLGQCFEEFVISKTPPNKALDQEALITGSDHRVKIPDVVAKAQPFIPEVPKLETKAIDEEEPMASNSMLQKAVTKNTVRAEQKGTGLPAVKPAVTNAENSGSFFYSAKPVESASVGGPNNVQVAATNPLLRGSAKPAEKKEMEPFFFTPTATASKEVQQPRVMAKDNTFTVAKNDDEKSGFFTKAVQSVVNTVKSFNKDDEKEEVIEPKQTRESINLQLISVLEKKIELLKANGQADMAAQATKDLLEAYGEMASSLKAKKQRLN